MARRNSSSADVMGRADAEVALQVALKRDECLVRYGRRSVSRG